MPIDKQVRAHLDIAQGRMTVAGHDWANRQAIEIPELPRVFDCTVVASERVIPVRIYVPASKPLLPICIWIHGGGWVQGSIDTNDSTCRFLAIASQAIVVSVGYRLAPMVKFPGAMDDCYMVADWVVGNAGGFGGDASRIAIAGASAGGNLAAAVVLLARERAHPSFVHQLLVYPVLDLQMNTASYDLFGQGYGLDTAMMRHYRDAYTREHADIFNPYVSPLRVVDLEGLPSTHVITAEFDVLRDEGEAYASRLEQAGIHVRSSRYDGMIHTFFNASNGFDKTFDAINDAGMELQRAFLGL